MLRFIENYKIMSKKYKKIDLEKKCVTDINF